MARPGRHGWPVYFGAPAGLYGAEDFINRQGPLTTSTHGQSPWRGLTGATNAEFRPGSVASRLGALGRLGLGPPSLLGGLLAHSPDAGRGSDLTGMDPGYMLGPIVDPTFEPTAPFHFRDVLGHYENQAVPGHLPMDITETPAYSTIMGAPHSMEFSAPAYQYSTEDLVTPEVDEVTPELDENTRALIDFDMEQNRQTMGLDPAPWGASPVLQGLSTYSPAFASATPMSTSSAVAPVGSFLSADSTPSSVGQYGWGSYTPSTDYPAVPESLVHSNIAANLRGEMVDPSWSGPFAPFAGGSFLRGLTGADAIDFGTAVTGATQATPGAEYAANLASIGLSPTRPGGHGTQHPGRGSEIEAALAATGHVMSPGQFAQQYFDKTDTVVNQALSKIASAKRSWGTRTNTQQTIDAYKAALNNQRALAEDTDATAAIAAQIAAQDAAVAAYGEDQAGQNTYGQASTGWAPGQALTTMDLLGNVVDVTLENDPVSVAIANARKSALANPDITVANTVAESVTRGQATVDAMGLTGAALAAASKAAAANLGYVTPDMMVGFQETQNAQNAAEAAAAAIAASYSEAQDYGGEDEADPGDTMAGFGSVGVSDAEINAVMAQIVADALEAEDPMSSRYGAHYGGGEEGYGGGFGAPGGSGGGGGYEV